MKTSTKAAVIVILCTILAFLFTPFAPLGSQVWPEPAALEPAPTGLQVAMLMFYTFIASLGFGLGVAFLLFGYSHVKRVFNDRFTPWVFFGIFWFMWSWWIHDIGHITSHGHIAWLLFLEYAFHASSIVFGAIIALACIKGRRR